MGGGGLGVMGETEEAGFCAARDPCAVGVRKGGSAQESQIMMNGLTAQPLITDQPGRKSRPGRAEARGEQMEGRKMEGGQRRLLHVHVHGHDVSLWEHI